MTTLEVDTVLTRAGTASFGHLGDRIAESVKRFERDMAVFGQCWGTSDEIAQVFQREFVPKRDELIEGCWATVKALGGIADRGLQAMNSLEHVEKGNHALAARSVTG